MPQRVGGPWLRVGKIIELFSAMGCTLGELPQPIHGSLGTWRVRYLYSPETENFVSLSDLDDDEFISPSELESWERVLGIEIPKGEDQH
jgi:hypothetical protein